MRGPLEIRESQLVYLANTSFHEQMVRVIGTADPGAISELRSEESRRMVIVLANRASDYGLISELDVGRFVLTAWLLGPDFDTRFPAIGEILSMPDVAPAVKTDAVQTLTTEILNTLHQGRRT